MRGCRWRLAGVLLAVMLAMAELAGCSQDAQPQAEGAGKAGSTVGEQGVPQPVDVPLTADAGRASDGVVAAGAPGAPYNYGPTVMIDGGRTRVWWCSQYPSSPPPGDDLLYGESASLDGPFTGPGGTAPRAVLSGNPGHFDGQHTCDPSVVRVGSTYYLYYTGAAGDHALGNSIGLATSSDGLTWTRADGGNPIVGPASDVHRDNTYGAGQPAVVYVDGWFYLMFTDTTGRAAGWNGAGQFLVRSKDPAFATGVQALGDNGFTPVPSTATPRTRSIVDAFSADLMWVDALNAFAIAHETVDGTTITFYNRDFTSTPYRPVIIPGPWEEGPGLARGPDGHAPVSVADPCGRVPVDLLRATVIGPADAPTDLRHFGLDITGVSGCATRDQALTVLNGFAMPSPVRTMDLVVEGKLVRVDRRSVAERLARKVLDHRIDVLDEVPVAAHISSGVPAVQAPGFGTGLIVDGRLLPVGSADVVALNGSTVEPITAAQWLGYPMGPAL